MGKDENEVNSHHESKKLFIKTIGANKCVDKWLANVTSTPCGFVQYNLT